MATPKTAMTNCLHALVPESLASITKLIARSIHTLLVISLEASGYIILNKMITAKSRASSNKHSIIRLLSPDLA